MTTCTTDNRFWRELYSLPNDPIHYGVEDKTYQILQPSPLVWNFTYVLKSFEAAFNPQSPKNDYTHSSTVLLTLEDDISVIISMTFPPKEVMRIEDRSPKMSYKPTETYPHEVTTHRLISVEPSPEFTQPEISQEFLKDIPVTR